MKPDCYGRIFPSVVYLETNKDVRGKVFAYRAMSRGCGIHERHVAADMTQWEECHACPDFDGCFALSLGKLALEQAVAGR